MCRMDVDEAEDYVVGLLQRTGPLTTMEIERIAGEDDRRCPDQTVLFLAKMRAKNLIVGEVSIERNGWLWSLPGGVQVPLG
jgi:hypothetical protein